MKIDRPVHQSSIQFVSDTSHPGIQYSCQEGSYPVSDYCECAITIQILHLPLLTGQGTNLRLAPTVTFPRLHTPNKVSEVFYSHEFI